MCKNDRDPLADDQKAFQDIVELIGTITTEEIWALHLCASSLVRCDIEKAVRQLILQGDQRLSGQFPELVS